MPASNRSTNATPKNVGRSSESMADALLSKRIDRITRNNSHNGAKSVTFVRVTGYNSRSNSKTLPARHKSLRITKHANANGSNAFGTIPIAYFKYPGNRISRRKAYISDSPTGLKL